MNSEYEKCYPWVGTRKKERKIFKALNFLGLNHVSYHEVLWIPSIELQILNFLETFTKYLKQAIRQDSWVWVCGEFVRIESTKFA